MKKYLESRGSIRQVGTYIIVARYSAVGKGANGRRRSTGNVIKLIRNLTSFSINDHGRN